MLHLNSGFERLLFKSRQMLLKPTQVAQRHTGAWHFPMWCSSYPPRICETHCPIYQKWSGRLNWPSLFMEKASRLKASSKNTAHRNVLVPRMGCTIHSANECRWQSFSHPAKLPMKIFYFLGSGRHRKKVWHFSCQEIVLCPPCSQRACWGWDLWWWDWAGSHNSNCSCLKICRTIVLSVSDSTSISANSDWFWFATGMDSGFLPNFLLNQCSVLFENILLSYL